MLNPIFVGNVYQGGNLFDNFQKLNAELQKDGYIPLCNGARKDVSLSGAVSDMSKGAMLYQGDPRDSLPLVYIFDEAKLEAIDKVMSI